MDEREYRRRSEARRRVVSKRREEQEEKREFGRFAMVVILLAVAIIVVSLYILCYVREIKVENNQYSSDTQVLTWIYEDPVSVNSIATFIKYNYLEYELPGQMKSVKVSLNSPWSITLSIQDKIPIAGLAVEEGYIYCDEEGRVILESDTALEELILIDNIEVVDYTLYEILEIEDTEVFKNAVEVYDTLSEEGLTAETISLSSGAGITIIIGDVEILLGEDSYQEKIAQIEPILENLENQLGTLDLSKYTTSDDIITFVPKKSENSQNSID